MLAWITQSPVIWPANPVAGQSHSLHCRLYCHVQDPTLHLMETITHCYINTNIWLNTTLDFIPHARVRSLGSCASMYVTQSCYEEEHGFEVTCINQHSCLDIVRVRVIQAYLQKVQTVCLSVLITSPPHRLSGMGVKGPTVREICTCTWLTMRCLGHYRKTKQHNTSRHFHMSCHVYLTHNYQCLMYPACVHWLLTWAYYSNCAIG